MYPSKLKKKDYNVTIIPGDGDCGYTAYGITRADAVVLLKKHVHSIKHVMVPAVKEALLEHAFYDYLQAKKILSNDISFQDIQYNLDHYAVEPEIVQAYIDYDIQDKNVSDGGYNRGYAHPAVLQAIAQAENKELRIWVPALNPEEGYVPFVTSEGEYNYHPPIDVDSSKSVDLVFVNGNHFDRLEPVKGIVSVPVPVPTSTSSQEIDPSLSVASSPSFEPDFETYPFGFEDIDDIVQDGDDELNHIPAPEPVIVFNEENDEDEEDQFQLESQHQASTSLTFFPTPRPAPAPRSRPKADEIENLDVTEQTQLELDEKFARELQAVFDAEIDVAQNEELALRIHLEELADSDPALATDPNYVQSLREAYGAKGDLKEQKTQSHLTQLSQQGHLQFYRQHDIRQYREFSSLLSNMGTFSQSSTSRQPCRSDVAVENDPMFSHSLTV